MATALCTLSRDVGERDGSSVLYTWPLTSANTDGAVVEWTEWVDRTWVVDSAAWGGATLVIQGSNDLTNWFTMTNAAGAAALSFTVGTVLGFTSVEGPRYARPNLSVAGTNAVVGVTLLARRHTQLRT